MNLKKFVWGETLLWLGFAFFVAVASDVLDDTFARHMDDPAMMAGLFALAAIGVRSTRPAPTEASDDA